MLKFDLIYKYVSFRYITLYSLEGLEYPKSIFCSKNIRTLSIHRSSDINKDSWIMKPSAMDGHFCAHYRLKQEKLYSESIEPIRNLNIDFEYMTYILKKYTKFCSSSFNGN